MIPYYQQLKSQLASEEGVRTKVYDDATGQPITPNTTVQGHPTIGIGRALDVHGLSDAEIDMLLQNDIDAICTALDSNIPWWRQLVDVRQAVLIDMAFNMGVGGLMGWPNTLNDIRMGNYSAAADAMRTSLWAHQVGRRAQNLAAQMQSGQW